MAKDRPMEIEIKLALPDESSYRRLRAMLGPPMAAVLQENRFFDGPCGELGSRQTVLRLRRELELQLDSGSAGDPVRARAGEPADSCCAAQDDAATGDPARVRFFLTLKSGGTVRGSVHSREEIEAELPIGPALTRPDPGAILRLDAEPVRVLKAMAPELACLADLGGFSNLREIFLPPAGVVLLGNALWELDRTEFPGGIVEYELEVEMRQEVSGADHESRAEEELQQLLRSWSVPASAQPLSKYARFVRYRLGRGD